MLRQRVFLDMTMNYLHEVDSFETNIPGFDASYNRPATWSRGFGAHMLHILKWIHNHRWVNAQITVNGNHTVRCQLALGTRGL